MPAENRRHKHQACPSTRRQALLGGPSSICPTGDGSHPAAHARNAGLALGSSTHSGRRLCPSPRCHGHTHATCLNCQNLPTPDPTLGDFLQQQPPPCLPTPLLLPSSGTGSRPGRRESSGHESVQTPLLPAASPRHSRLSHGPFYPVNMISGLRVLAILFPLPEMLFPTLLLDQLLLVPPTSPSCHIPKGALSWPQPKLGP